MVLKEIQMVVLQERREKGEEQDLIQMAGGAGGAGDPDGRLLLCQLTADPLLASHYP